MRPILTILSKPNSIKVGTGLTSKKTSSAERPSPAISCRSSPRLSRRPSNSSRLRSSIPRARNNALSLLRKSKALRQTAKGFLNDEGMISHQRPSRFLGMRTKDSKSFVADETPTGDRPKPKPDLATAKVTSKGRTGRTGGRVPSIRPL